MVVTCIVSLLQVFVVARPRRDQHAFVLGYNIYLHVFEQQNFVRSWLGNISTFSPRWNEGGETSFLNSFGLHGSQTTSRMGAISGTRPVLVYQTKSPCRESGAGNNKREVEKMRNKNARDANCAGIQMITYCVMRAHFLSDATGCNHNRNIALFTFLYGEFAKGRYDLKQVHIGLDQRSFHAFHDQLGCKRYLTILFAKPFHLTL